jgi:hypothetical protein
MYVSIASGIGFYTAHKTLASPRDAMLHLRLIPFEASLAKTIFPSNTVRDGLFFTKETLRNILSTKKVPDNRWARGETFDAKVTIATAASFYSAR